jgi:hypothetical protein
VENMLFSNIPQETYQTGQKNLAISCGLSICGLECLSSASSFLRKTGK